MLLLRNKNRLTCFYKTEEIYGIFTTPVATEYYRDQMVKQGVLSLDLLEGAKVLERSLSHGVGQVIAIKATKVGKEKIGVKDNRCIKVNHAISNSCLKEVIEMLPDRAKELEKLKEKRDSQLLGKFALGGLLQCIKKLGWHETKVYKDVEELKSHLTIQDKYERWLSEIVRVLIEKGMVKTAQYKIELKVKFKVFDIDKEAAKIVEGNPDLKAYVELLKDCLKNLGDIVSGKTPATDILFPNSSMGKVQGIYKNNPISDFYNESVADVVEAYVKTNKKRLQGKEKICILEVGAGTGGTSAYIFKRMKPYADILEYTYTDISKSFLLYAEDVYKEEAPYIKTALFNVEAPLAGQPIESNSYDIVVGTNVLHATKNMVNTMDQVKEVLKQNGILALNELIQNSLFYTLTFVLTDGWWLFEDAEIRLPGAPGLSFKQWGRVLSETGFGNTMCSNFEVQALGQQVIIAESLGFSRQKILTDSMLPEQNNRIATQKEIVKKKIMVPAQSRQQAVVDNQMVEDYIEKTICMIVSKTLKVPYEDLDFNDQFSDYGVDSILSVRIVNDINAQLTITLNTTQLFDYPDIVKLKKYIVDTFLDEIRLQVSIPKEEDNEVILKEITPPCNSVIEEPEVKHNRFIAKKSLINDDAGDVRLKDVGNSKLTISKEPVAIVGMSGKFGDADSIDSYWEALREGHSLVKEVPEDRIDLCNLFNINEFFQPELSRSKSYSKWGSFLNEIDKFDPLFFRISGIEAENMDPQQRFFLQQCWDALEDGGFNPKELSNKKCGVYVGVGASDYFCDIKEKDPSSFWGNSSSILVSRISYYLNLKGPAVAIDTACSSSLTAIHLGCQSLWSKETDIALAGGVFIQTTPKLYILSSSVQMLSADGQCFTFDNRANGFVPGEGVGVVVLKRLADAIKDKDHIYGVIKGTCINQDGTTNGITAPSSLSQKELELEVYKSFNINPETIQYVEAHGTGTKLGDPIEIQALTESFRKYTDKKQFCAIGSVKTNIGLP